MVREMSESKAFRKWKFDCDQWICSVKGIRRNGFYYLLGNIIIGSVAVVKDLKEECAIAWHLRLGHVSERCILELTKNGYLGHDGLKKLELCEECVLGKSNGANFNKAIRRTHNVLEYVHTDLVGPSRVASHEGNGYFMSLVNDHSRRV